MTHAGIGALAATAGLIVLLEAPAAVAQTGTADFPAPGSLHYVVIRDGDRIGSYDMVLSRDGDRFEVRTHTDIAVTVLGVVVYRLVSSSSELWVDGNLSLFDANSDDDGETHKVTVRSRADHFSVVENGVEHLVAGKLLPGTLWHPATLTATELVDPIDGRRNKVKVTDRGMEQIVVQGKSIRAHHVSITQKRVLEVWYSEGGQIVAISYRAWDHSLIRTKLQ